MNPRHSKWRDWARALRPTHWIKSGFCLAALFFHGDGLNPEAWLRILPVAVSFALAASAGYLFNDLLNIGEDRRHPRKRHRPIASGRLSFGAVRLVIIVLAVLSLGLTAWIYGPGPTLGVLAGYLGITALYSLFFRQVPFVDVIVIGLGFVARVAAGAYALDLVPTVWLLACTYTLALLLGFGKRKGEWRCMERHHQAVGQTRRALQGYTEKMLDRAIGVSALLAGGAYAAYCLQRPDRVPFILTTVPVFMGLVAYLRFAWRSESVETPERLFLHSPLLLVAVAVWVGMVVAFSLQA